MNWFRKNQAMVTLSENETVPTSSVQQRADFKEVHSLVVLKCFCSTELSLLNTITS